MDYILVFWALLATLFTWGLTALGAAVVFFFKDIRAIVLDSMLALASGVMIAASFWSLLLPGRDIALEIGQSPAVVLSIGFLTGAGFLILVNRLIPHLHFKDSVPSGRKSSLSRSVLLVLAISIHNIPEGLAIGVAFGSLAKGETLAGAVALAVGIGIQNIPEGSAVSVPLRREGLSRWKSFMVGQFSGLGEPVAAVIGAMLAVSVNGILPFALAFAAGCMIFVVVEELIPEAERGVVGKSRDLVSGFAIVGFVLMTVLDLAFS